MKGLSLEIRVGLLVLVAIGLLVGFIFLLGGVDFSEGYTVYVDFNNPGNVKPGAAVSIGSLRVGSVDEIEYRGGKLDPRTGRRALIRMRLSVDREVQETIHEDALFYVTSSSLLGESVVAIDPGTWEAPVLEEGAVVQGVDPPRLDLAMALAYELLDNMVRLIRSNRDEIQGLLTHLASMIRGLDELLTQERPRLVRILENVETATTEANELMRSVRGTVDGPRVQRSLRNLDETLAAVARDIDPILADARGALTKVNATLDTFGPEQRDQIQSTMRNVEELSVNANSAVTDAREIVAHIRAGRGTVGAIVMDEELYDDIQEMLRDLKHNPWKLFWRE